MSLLQQWRGSNAQIRDKHLRQVIAFAGDGRLRDGNETAHEFREFLREIPSTMLVRYATECLEEAFQDSGFALQDVINEIGRRLGIAVENGRYRGVKGENGFDGIWTLPDRRQILVEVKTTDAYRIDLNVVAAYAKQLVAGEASEHREVSVLLVVGRADTGDLEAQVRGSRHAWSMRLISVDALARRCPARS